MTIDKLIEKYTKPSILQLAGTNITVVETENVKSDLLELKEELMKEPVNLEYNHKVVKVPEMIANFIGDYEAEFRDGYTSSDSLLEMILDNWKSGYSEEYTQESHWISNNLCKFIDAVRFDCEVEQEPKWVVRSDKNAWFQSFNNDKDDMKYGFYSHSQVTKKSSAFLFENQDAADAVATLIGGYTTLADEVNHG